MFYTKANKQDTFLAHQLSRTEGPFCPARLKIPSRGHTSNPAIVLQKFRKQLAALYSTPGGFEAQQADALLASIPSPSLTTSQKDSLEEEVKQAFKSLKLRKRPGPDSYIALYYKKSQDILIPLLRKAF